MFYRIEVCGGFYQTHLNKLEQVIIDGMRIVTGATARSNVENLYQETAWNSFYIRRDIADLVMMFRIRNKHVPTYLSDICLMHNVDMPNYNFRNKRDILLKPCRTEVCRRSFLYFATELWNKLNIEIRQCTSIPVFKEKLKAEHKVPNVLYYYGERWPSVMHARLRIGCSKLNYDVHFNLHIPDVRPSCSCGAMFETVEHFFLHCPNYINIRNVLKLKVEQLTEFKIKTILFGSPNLWKEQNQLVFDFVHVYILESKRFS